MHVKRQCPFWKAKGNPNMNIPMWQPWDGPARDNNKEEEEGPHSRKGRENENTGIRGIGENLEIETCLNN